MNKQKLFAVLFLIISSFTYAQKRYVDVELVKMNNDTIQSKMMVIVNLFNKKLINDASFYKKSILVDDNKKKTAKIKAKDIKSLSFTNLYDRKVTYVNDGNQLKVLVNEKNEVFPLGMFNHRKNQLSKAIADHPELLKEIENQRMDDIDLLDILTRYNNSTL